MVRLPILDAFKCVSFRQATNFSGRKLVPSFACKESNIGN